MIQRDMQTLSSLFAIIDTPPTGRGKEGVGWAFSEDAVHQGLPSMEPVTALTILMGHEHLKQLLPNQILKHMQPYVSEAADILKTFNKKNYYSWMDKVRILPSAVLQPPKVDSESVQVIYEALLLNKQISCTYNGRGEQIISPYGIVQRANTIYLICRYFSYDDIRITAMQRFSDVVLLNDDINPDKTFDIDDYIDSGEIAWPWSRAAANKPIKLKANITEDLAFMVTETPLSENQAINDSDRDNWKRLTATVLDSHELRYWLLSQGDAVEILSPKGMRSWFKEVSNNMASLYKN
jgi:predicted DNA-binding transcriptional regulator YafY